MMEHKEIGGFSELTPPERLALISELWESLESEHVPVTSLQRDELDRRLTTLDADRKAGTPWELLRRGMASRYR